MRAFFKKMLMRLPSTRLQELIARLEQEFIKHSISCNHLPGIGVYEVFGMPATPCAPTRLMALASNIVSNKIVIGGHVVAVLLVIEILFFLLAGRSVYLVVCPPVVGACISISWWLSKNKVLTQLLEPHLQRLHEWYESLHMVDFLLEGKLLARDQAADFAHVSERAELYLTQWTMWILYNKVQDPNPLSGQSVSAESRDASQCFEELHSILFRVGLVPKSYEHFGDRAMKTFIAEWDLHVKGAGGDARDFELSAEFLKEFRHFVGYAIASKPKLMTL